MVLLDPDSLLKSFRLERCSGFKCFPYDYLTWHHKYFEVILYKNHMATLTLTGSSWFRWAVSVQIRQRTYATDWFRTTNESSVCWDLLHPEYKIILWLVDKLRCTEPLPVSSTSEVLAVKIKMVRFVFKKPREIIIICSWQSNDSCTYYKTTVSIPRRWIFLGNC